ncbi:MAG: SDR family NAD(P)-dependent oxidoreductase [Corynebacteriales bacterium]|nr:SDR family NAD(P)-dependent oxidoreductase [Mycobacteriales bacterium]
MPGAVIIGAGSGIGQSLAHRFAKEGMPIALIARTTKTLEAVAHNISHTGVQVITSTADSSNETALRAALDAATVELGTPDVVIYNAAIIQRDVIGELSARAHLEAWSVNVVGALTAAAHTIPSMARRGNGSFIVTGGMPEPKPEFVSLSIGKAGVRTLVELLDQTYRPAGIHVATVTVGGPVAANTDFDPDDIAEHYWKLHTQPQDQWVREIVHSGINGHERANPLSH